jgi:hypothetical protein
LLASPPNSHRTATAFPSKNQSDSWPCRGLKYFSDFQKFLLTADPNHFYIHGRPVPTEGRFANVTNAGRDAVDATARLTGDANADGEDVWS